MKKIFVIISLICMSFMVVSCSKTSTDLILNETTEQLTSQVDLGVEFALFEMAKFHSMAVTSDNKVFVWGSNQYGQLGETSNSESSINEITNYFNLSSNENIVDIALGEFHSSILTSDNRLFAWGSNAYGQFGDETTNSSRVPVEVSQHHVLYDGEKIIEIESGAGNLMSLTSEGRVFSWGYNEYGQVGVGTAFEALTKPYDLTPSLNLDSDEHVIDLSIGYHHSAVLTSGGRIILWGYNELGQLGNGTVNNVYSPIDYTEYVTLNAGETIIDIEMGYYHSSLLTSENRVFSWGLNENGQVGNETRENQLFPIDITDHFNLEEGDFITKLSYGGWSSSALSLNGEVFMWGANGQGRLAMTDLRDFIFPKNVTNQFDLYENEEFTDLVLDAWSSSVLTSQGRLFTWGRNNTFQLGHSYNRERNPEPIEIIIE